MSIKQLADAVRSKGRDEDTLLIHMTPGEVGGLQALAQAAGGSLTINPETGLPEAGFLKNILPTVLGATIGIATGNPLIGAAVAGGVGTATNKGDLGAGLTSALGAYGFGSLGGSLAAAGAAGGAGAAGTAGLAGLGQSGGATLGSSLGTSLAAPTFAAPVAGAGANTLAGVGQVGGASLNSALAGPIASPALQAGVPQMSMMDKLSAGLKNVSANPMPFLKDNLGALGMAGTSLMGAMTPDAPEAETSGEAEGNVRPYSVSSSRNPNWGQPGQSYFNQSVTAGTPIPASAWGSRPVFNQGGIVALADGGIPNRYQATQQGAQGWTPSTTYMSRNPDVQSYYAANVAQTGMTPDQFAQQHFAQYGANEGRQAPVTNTISPQLQVSLMNDMQRAHDEYITQPTLAPRQLTDFSQLQAPKTPSASSVAAPVDDYLTKLQDLEQRYQALENTNQGPQFENYGYNNAKNGGLIKRYAQGGIASLGSYSDGGQLLKGPGDGVSDSIPATIGGDQPAALADGEFVIPARIVSELGNGSTDAGARRLYAMMDRIQKNRKKTVGDGNVAVDSKSYKHLPA